VAEALIVLQVPPVVADQRLLVGVLRRKAQAALERTRALRERLYAVFRPVADGTEPSPDAVAHVGEWWRADCNRRQLISRSGMFELRLEVGDDDRGATGEQRACGGEPDRLVEIGFDLLSHDGPRRVARDFLRESREPSR